MCNPFRDIARTAFGLVLAATERAVPFDEARADAWLKTTAAADALAEREAEEEVAEPMSHWKVGDSYCGLCGENITHVDFHACPMRAKTSAAGAGAGEGPTEVSARPDPAAPSVGCWPPVALTAAEVRDVRALLAAEHATEFDWQTWAIPAITDVLAEHFCVYQDDAVMYECYGPDGPHGPHDRFGDRFGDWQDWSDHVAPLIAERIHQAAAHQAQQ